MSNKHDGGAIFSKNQKAVLVAVGLALSFSLMGVWVRMMQGSFDTFQQVYLRILLAGLVALFVFRKKFSQNLFSSIPKREWAIYGARGFMAYTIGVAGFTVAVQHTSLGTISFISALPILGLLAWIMFREKIPKKSFVPIGLSVAGLALLTGIDLRNFSMGVGEWAAIVCMFGFDIGYLMSRMHDKKRNNFENTTILLLVSWVPLLILSIIQREGILPHNLSPVAILGLVLSVVANIAGLYAINYVFTNLKAYIAGNILLLEGVFSLILGLLLYDEPIVGSVVLGGLIVVVSAIMINNINKDVEEAPDPLLDENIV
jgi:drug/metabolite transporter (DMT)-like permease